MQKRAISVIVNVYDLVHESTQKYAHPLGVGAYHTGIELAGVEYSFGGHQMAGTGVFEIAPRSAEGVVFRESINMGEVEISPQDLHRLLDKMREEYQGRSYHTLERNCNHFSNDLCVRLTGKKLPGWLNRLAYLGTFVKCWLPEYLNPVPPPGYSNNASQAGTKSASAPAGFVSFSGAGIALASNSTAPSNDMYDVPSENAKMPDRQLLALAALRRLENNGS